jgi:hypothetical protein
LTECCRKSSCSSNSFDSDVMIMRLIKIFNVHDKQFIFKQRMSDKMIEWWKSERREDVILCSKLFIHIFTCSEFFHFFHDRWFTFSTYHFRATNFFYHRFRQTTRISFIFYSISRQAYEFDKLIDEHVSYSSLDSEKISLLRALCLIFFFWNSKRFTIRKKRRFHWQLEKREDFIDIN